MISLQVLAFWLVQGSGPGKWTIGVQFCVESDCHVKNSQILYLEPKIKQNVLLSDFVFGRFWEDVLSTLRGLGDTFQLFWEVFGTCLRIDWIISGSISGCV